ncbi:long-chain fatty acid--CoA ligase [Paenibacillus sp. JNUCC31]|uniref:ANL family adenylate-forming protein n=1 Tax=Paenibacillus sp. JNUCC-31 TaxID=2777983 RepID=UPI0017839AEF|nr:fatty acid--CoA ligase family protein [Paenibacillus sp. JNUCC-31]QOS77048.1 long-chain fatty acid--CoA ligase [Paenibacillus sp. JNUCC-31]
MNITFLLERFAAYGNCPALIWEGEQYSYSWLLNQVHTLNQWISREGLEGAIIALEEDYSPYSAAALIALLERDCIVVPLDRHLVEAKRNEYIALAQVEWRMSVGNGEVVVRRCSVQGSRSPILARLVQEKKAGLVIFSSGSTGRSKAAVHCADRLLDGFRRQVRPLCTIPFMMFDHIGGLNTMLQSLSSGGCLCVIPDRSPVEVCRAIEKYRVQALPVSPTFMNLMLLSGVYREFDLSSLEVVSYGSEVMPETLLSAWNRQFPNVRTVQAYGMSELGILPTRSKDSGSLLFTVRGEGVNYRIVNGLLEILTETAMIGYLNAPSPFTEDGWLQTGDEAEMEDGYIRILGRRSEIINVGGRKVYPAEVESILEQMDSIETAVVSGEPSGITGQMVKATIRLTSEQSLKELRRQIWDFCQDKLPPYKIPQKIVVTQETLTSPRMKKLRNAGPIYSVRDEVAASMEENLGGTN